MVYVFLRDENISTSEYRAQLINNVKAMIPDVKSIGVDIDTIPHLVNCYTEVELSTQQRESLANYIATAVF